ncbi:MAG: lysozyme inhibitor LprI family protein [Pseudomonas sp.]|uniref:lysozyme inhibitor LprI family protein n=1 Tax=Pseudomonas sp. TaxID=306 RepID=UPI003D09B301
MLRALLLFTLIVPAAVCAGSDTDIDCSAARANAEVEHCVALAQQETEEALNGAYKALVAELSQPDTELDNYTAYRKKLLVAQRAWIAFRDVDCAAQYEMHRTSAIGNTLLLNCKQQRAEQRIKELQNYAPY